MFSVAVDLELCGGGPFYYLLIRACMTYHEKSVCAKDILGGASSL